MICITNNEKEHFCNFTEEDVIQFFMPATLNAQESLCLADDIALLRSAEKENFAISTDLAVEGIHFFSSSSPKSVACRLMCRNISDIVCKGIKPSHFTLSCALKATLSKEWVESFAKEIYRIAKSLDMPLIGGDTTLNSKDGSFFSITIFGKTEKDSISIPLRSNANVGDIVFVTGIIGKSYLGYLAILNSVTKAENTADQEALDLYINSYNFPEPQMHFLDTIAKHASSCLDLSDGITKSANLIQKASNLQLKIEASKIPITPYAQACRIFQAKTKKPDATTPIAELLKNEDKYIENILNWGDDYGFLLTCHPDKTSLLTSKHKDITKVGVVCSNHQSSRSTTK